jgi:hypothetical protein
MPLEDDGLVMALSIDGLQLGDDELRAIASSLIGLARYHDRKELQLNPKSAVYNVALTLAGRSSVSLAFVPTIVERFPELTPEQVQQLLLQLDREGLIELRPDGGWGRFSTSELAVCPDGPDNSKLLWARVCEVES